MKAREFTHRMFIHTFLDLLVHPLPFSRFKIYLRVGAVVGVGCPTLFARDFIGNALLTFCGRLRPQRAIEIPCWCGGFGELAGFEFGRV